MSIIGVDLGGTRIKTGIISRGKVEELKVYEVVSGNGLTAHLPLLKASVRQALKGWPAADIEGIGIAFPGLVDTKRNKVIDTNGKYDDAPALDLAFWAQEELGLKLKIENDARLACLGEWRFGAGKNNPDMVMCTLGTGVGTAAIINNRLLRGKHFQAGVLGGHSIIDFKNTGNQCSCGNNGCVEATASTWMIERMAMAHPMFSESLLSGLDKIDLAAVFELSGSGDILSGQLRDHCMEAWAAGLINLIHAYDPEVVVIGGGIMHSGNILLPYFRKVIAEKAWCPWGVPDIRPADYPDTAALLGATLLFE